MTSPTPISSTTATTPLTPLQRLAARAARARASEKNVPSPCISVCQMDPTNTFCEGCLRTGAEIGKWSQSTDAQKKAVWSLIGQRVAQTNAIRG